MIFRKLAVAAALLSSCSFYSYADIDTKRTTTRYLHLPPLLVDDVPEILK